MITYVRVREEWDLRRADTKGGKDSWRWSQGLSGGVVSISSSCQSRGNSHNEEFIEITDKKLVK